MHHCVLFFPCLYINVFAFVVSFFTDRNCSFLTTFVQMPRLLLKPVAKRLEMVSGSLALPAYFLFVLHLTRAADSKRKMSCRIQQESVHMFIHLSVRLSISPVGPERLTRAPLVVWTGRTNGQTDRRMDEQMYIQILPRFYTLQDIVLFWAAAQKARELMRGRKKSRLGPPSVLWPRPLVTGPGETDSCERGRTLEISCVERRPKNPKERHSQQSESVGFRARHLLFVIAHVFSEKKKAKFTA